MDVFLQLLMLGLLAGAMILAVYNTIKRRQRQALAAGPPLGYERAPAQAAPSIQPAPPSLAPATQVAPLHSRAPRARKHTAIAGSTGDGKTTTVNTMLVWDIVHGVHPIVCSTHFTAYHPEDQPIDLRPLAHLFEVAYTLPAIAAVLTYACDEIDARMVRYRAGLDVGQDIVLYLGEWGAIRRGLGESAVDALMKILDEGRKTRIWIGAMELHSALVGRLGGDSGVREAFTTRLTGNIDATTWKVFVGRDIKQQPVPKGFWMTDEGLVEVVRPSAQQIQMIAERKPQRTWQPIISEAVLHPPVFREEITIERVQAGIPENTGQNTAPPPTANTAPKLTKTRAKAIRDAAALGASRNIMAGLIGGDKGQALALIEEVLGPASDEKGLQDVAVDAEAEMAEGVPH